MVPRARIIDGRAISNGIISSLEEEVASLYRTSGKYPGLATILVGNHPASVSYVALKIKMAQKIGFCEVQRNLPESTSESELIQIINNYNQDDRIDAILVQLPLPPHIEVQKVMSTIHPGKDVDGFHPINLGHLFVNYRKEQIVPCTPAGIMELLDYMKIKLEGAHVVVVGRSNLVGKPLSMMLVQSGDGGNCSVTMLHSKSRNLRMITRQADILIVAIGRPEWIRGKDIKPGAVVIDVGVSQVGKRTIERWGRKVSVPILKGDVAYEEALGVAGFITPVPGGVGPMTIALLMKNTLKCFKDRHCL